MKHHDARRPVGKCKGCCLNFKSFCAAGFEPKFQIRHGSCSHYDDVAMLEQALNRPRLEGIRLARQRRQEKAVTSAREPHYNGRAAPRASRALATAQFR